MNRNACEDAACEPRTPSPSPGGGGSASSEAARRGGVLFRTKYSPHPDARFTRVDPPPPGEGGTERAACASSAHTTALKLPHDPPGSHRTRPVPAAVRG